MPLILTPEQLTARHVGEDLESADLVEIIDAEEAYLAARIGTLTGPYVQTFAGTGYGPLRLNRRVASITSISDDGTAVDAGNYTLVDGQRIVAGWGDWYWMGPVVVTAALDDESIVRNVLVDLIRLRLSDTGNESESAQGQSRSNVKTAEERRDEIIRILMPGRGIL